MEIILKMNFELVFEGVNIGFGLPWVAEEGERVYYISEAPNSA